MPEAKPAKPFHESAPRFLFRMRDLGEEVKIPSPIFWEVKRLLLESIIPENHDEWKSAYIAFHFAVFGSAPEEGDEFFTHLQHQRRVHFRKEVAKVGTMLSGKRLDFDGAVFWIVDHRNQQGIDEMILLGIEFGAPNAADLKVDGKIGNEFVKLDAWAREGF